MEDAIILLTNEVQALQQALTRMRVSKQQYNFLPQDNSFDETEMQRTSITPTECSTFTGSETATGIKYTITIPSTLRREEIYGAMDKNWEEILCTERSHT